MANNLTLSEVLELLRGGDLATAMEHSDEIHDYAARVDEVATDVFSRHESDYVKGMLGLVQSLAISIMISRGALYH